VTDWGDRVSTWLLDHGLRIAAIVLIAIVVRFVLRRAVRRLVRRTVESRLAPRSRPTRSPGYWPRPRARRPNGAVSAPRRSGRC
jgi:hypothetical protein